MTDVMSVWQLVNILMQVAITVGVVVVWYRVRRELAEDIAELQRQVDETERARAERSGC